MPLERPFRPARFPLWLGALLLLTEAPPASIGDFFSGILDGMRRQYRMARLATLEPDSVLVLPLRTTRVSRVRDTWGAARGADRTHQGQDLFAPRGTPVYSATEGYVTNVGENRLGGNVVWVMGAGRRVYYYAHLDRHADSLGAGDWVDTGSVLGYVGTTGNARGTPPHLHFGVYTLGGAIDPLPLMRDAPAAAKPGSGTRAR
jgi:murein DD-endopeptidase MepM/ murein hydrolase activator NlpD